MVKGSSIANADSFVTSLATFSDFNNFGESFGSSVMTNLFLKQEFAGAAGGFDYGLDERDAELAFFEFQSAFYRAASGRGDGVLQERGVVAGFEYDAGGAFHGLRGEQCGDIARQADLHASLSKGFENDVRKCRSAGREPRDGVHILFVHHNGASNRFEHRPCNLQMLCSGVSAPADAGHATSDCRWRIRHRSDHRHVFAYMLLQLARRPRS